MSRGWVLANYITLLQHQYVFVLELVVLVKSVAIYDDDEDYQYQYQYHYQYQCPDPRDVRHGWDVLDHDGAELLEAAAAMELNATPRHATPRHAASQGIGMFWGGSRIVSYCVVSCVKSSHVKSSHSLFLSESHHNLVLELIRFERKTKIVTF